MITYSDVTVEDRLRVAIVVSDRDGKLDNLVINILDFCKIPWSAVNIDDEMFVSIHPGDYYLLPVTFVQKIYDSRGFFLIYSKNDPHRCAFYNKIASDSLLNGLDSVRAFQKVSNTIQCDNIVFRNPQEVAELFCGIVLGVFDGMDKSSRLSIEKAVGAGVKKWEDWFRGRPLKILI